MGDKRASYYPYVWYEHGGWWFKIFGECFGPYDLPADARYNLQAIAALGRYLDQKLSPGAT